MRAIFLALPLAILFAATARSDEASDLRDRAIKAYAKDPADLKKIRIHTLKAKGVSTIGNEPVPVTVEMAASWPGHLKAISEFGTGANKRVIAMCGADDRGWKKIDAGMPFEFSGEELSDFRGDAYAVWVSTLITLNDADSKLTAAGRAKVGDDPVLGLKVSRRSWPDVTLYFHEKSGLLRKMSYRSGALGATTSKDVTYDGHKQSGGLMLPTRQTTNIDGKELYTWTEMEYAFPEKLDPKVFEKQ